MPDLLHHTYLDTTGHSVIIIIKQNLVESHSKFQAEVFLPLSVHAEGTIAIVVGALYLMILLVIVYVRLDFAIDKNEVFESRLRISG